MSQSGGPTSLKSASVNIGARPLEMQALTLHEYAQTGCLGHITTLQRAHDGCAVALRAHVAGLSLLVWENDVYL